MPDAALERVLDALWPPGLPGHTAVFAIVDGARNERIYGAVRGTYLPKDCLYSGDLPWQLQMTAPYLVRLEREDRFTEFLIRTGWGNSWATFLRTETGIKQLRRHLREFLRVRDEAGKRLDFPLLRSARPAGLSADVLAGELNTFFGPISAFITEGEAEGEILEFRNEAGTLSVITPPAGSP